MKYLVVFMDCWSHKIHEVECLNVESLQKEMHHYFRNDCVCISLEVIK